MRNRIVFSYDDIRFICNKYVDIVANATNIAARSNPLCFRFADQKWEATMTKTRMTVATDTKGLTPGYMPGFGNDFETEALPVPCLSA